MIVISTGVIKTEVVVVGGGVMGAATGWALARAGRPPIVLERFGPRHTNGASHGLCRNFNVMYGEPHYVDLLVESRRLWDELSDASGQQLLELVGIVKHGIFPAAPQMAAALAAAGIRTDFLEPEAAAERWPGMRFDGPVLHSPDSGRVRADDSVQAMLDQIRRLGGDVRHHHTATSIRPSADGVSLTVETPEGSTEMRASVVVVTAGAWTDRTIGNVVRLPPTSVRQVQPAHFQVTSQAADWPSFMQVAPSLGGGRLEGEEIYGLYEAGRGLKVGWHGRGLPIDPDSRTDRYDESELTELKEYVAHWLPGAEPDSARLISCTYTSTPSARFVLDRVGDIVIGKGFSGQGFKFAPAVGSALAALALGSGTPHPAFWITSHVGATGSARSW